jgi:uncharacterized membrane protein
MTVHAKSLGTSVAAARLNDIVAQELGHAPTRRRRQHNGHEALICLKFRSTYRVMKYCYSIIMPFLQIPLRSGPVLTALMATLVVFMTLGTSADPAHADFRLCNNTASRVGVAIGYKDNDGWTTEGWWNLPSRKCETLLRGQLVARYYYVYAVDYDRGGEWSGRAYMCTRDKEFIVRGTENCLARGFDRTGFFEVDTGEQRSWTVQLTEAAQTPGRQRSPILPPTNAPGQLIPPATGNPR